MATAHWKKVSGVIRDRSVFFGSEEFHLLRIVHLTLDLVSDRPADGALHLELGGRAVLDGDAQADGELAVVIGCVFRLAPVGGEQFANVVDCLILDGLCGVVLHDDFGVWVELKF